MSVLGIAGQWVERLTRLLERVAGNVQDAKKGGNASDYLLQPINFARVKNFNISYFTRFSLHHWCALNGEYSSFKECSKGCKSLMRSVKGKHSKSQGRCGRPQVGSKRDCPAKGGSTDEQKPHTEAGQVG
jgi:hypothetical protein